MLISFLGTRGTVPSAEESTVSFLIDNQFLFDACTEVVQTFERLLVHWRSLQNAGEIKSLLSKYGNPSLSRIEHIFLTHLHWDHWGGVLHLLHRAIMLDRELRQKKPIKIYVAKKSADLLRLRLYIILGSEVGEVAEVIPLDHGDSLQIGQYRISVALTTHHPLGSLAYLIECVRTKLKVEKARELGIPFDSNLSKIDKGKKIEIEGVTISREDVFYDEIDSVGYTGDVSENEDLNDFFNKVNVLIVESTYLEEEENYHLESHSSMNQVIRKWGNQNGLSLLIPIHFSKRYTWQEIEEKVNDKRKETKLTLLVPRTTMMVEYQQGNWRIFPP